MAGKVIAPGIAAPSAGEFCPGRQPRARQETPGDE